MRRIYFPSLPDLWTNVRLFDISEVVMGQSPPGETYNENKLGLPFFQGKAEFGELYPTPQKWCSAPTRIAEAGDILISVRAPVGATNIAKEKCCIGRGLAAIRPINDVAERDFLLFYLRAIEEFLSTAGYGSTFQAINKNDLLNLRIPLPPLPEQEKIVNILRQATKLSRLRNDTLKLVLKIPQTLFIEIFGPPDTKVNQKWDIVTLGNTVQVETGGTPSRFKKDFFIGDINWAKSTELKDNLLDETEEKISNEALSSSNAKLFPKNTILVAMYGQGQTRGRTAMLTAPSTCNQACAAILPSNHFLPNYLWLWFRCSYKRVRSLGRGGQQENLNLNIIRNLKVPKPPMSIQKKFDSLFILLNKQILQINEELPTYTKLIKLLTIEAMTGNLTELWRHINNTTLSKAAKNRENILGISMKKVDIKEYAPEQRPWLAQPNRHWLMEQLSDLQGSVYHALREWKGTLIPSEDLEDFREQAFPVEHLEDANDKILRALHQLTGLGLIAKISLYNHEGDYVTAFRGLREEELSQASDRQYLAKG